MVAEQRGYTPWRGEEPNDRERGSPCNMVKDGVGVVKTIPRKRPQRRRAEMKADGRVPQILEQTDEVIKVTFSERVSECVWGRIEKVSERDEIDECDWTASASQAEKTTDSKTVEVCDGCGTSAELSLSCTKRQRKMASKLHLRLGGEDQNAVGSEHSGLLVGSAANLEYPLLSGPGWDGAETDLKENVLELEADDLDEKIINDGVEVKRFKVRAWGGVHTVW